MPIPKFTQASKSTLQVGITATESTSIVLKKLVDIYGTALAFTDFTTKVYLTIEPGSDNEEIISCAGFTVNSDGTVTLDTTIVRGLAAKSPYGATGTARSHSAGVTVIISNNPQFYDAIMDFVVNLEDSQTIAGKKTFSTVPDTSAAPVAGNDLANKTYVDAAGIGAATSVQVVVTGKAGEVIADGDLLYFDTITNNEWMLCDADVPATVENVQLGIAQGAGTNGVDITNGILLRGIDDAQTGLVAGNIMYASNTPGDISTTPGTTEVTIGIVPAGETTKIYFSPRFNQMLTENQQDLIAQAEAGTDWYAASSVGTDAYAMTIVPAITAYTTGMKFRFKADVANTGACTLAVSGLAALAIKKLNDQDTATGDIEAGQIVEVVYDGTDFQMQSQVGVTAGLKISNPFTTGENVTAGNPLRITVGVNEVVDATGNVTPETTDTTTTRIGTKITVGGSNVFLNQIKFYINKNASPGDLTVNVRSGSITGTIIQTATILEANIPATKAEYTMTFNKMVRLSASTAYYVEWFPAVSDATNSISIYYTGSHGGAGDKHWDYISGAWASVAAPSLDFRYGVSDGTAGQVKKAQANSKTEASLFVGFANETITSGNTVNVISDGTELNQSGLTIGESYYLSDTAGSISTTAGTIKLLVGVAISATVLMIKKQIIDSSL